MVEQQLQCSVHMPSRLDVSTAGLVGTDCDDYDIPCIGARSITLSNDPCCVIVTVPSDEPQGRPPLQAAGPV